MNVPKLKISYLIPIDLKIERMRLDLINLLAHESDVTKMEEINKIIADIKKIQSLLDEFMVKLEN